MILSSTIHTGVPVVNIADDINERRKWEDDETLLTIDFSILGDKRLSLALTQQEAESIMEQIRACFQELGI